MHTEGVISGTYEIEVLGSVRRYVVFRPRGIDPATIPTIIDLHGSGSWPYEHVAVTAARAFAAVGAVVVVPQAGIPFRLLEEWPAGGHGTFLGVRCTVNQSPGTSPTTWLSWRRSLHV